MLEDRVASGREASSSQEQGFRLPFHWRRLLPVCFRSASVDVDSAAQPSVPGDAARSSCSAPNTPTTPPSPLVNLPSTADWCNSDMGVLQQKGSAIKQPTDPEFTVVMGASHLGYQGFEYPGARIQQLKRLPESPGSLVYQGVWQGVPVRVKFLPCPQPAAADKALELLAALASNKHVVSIYSYGITHVPSQRASASSSGLTSRYSSIYSSGGSVLSNDSGVDGHVCISAEANRTCSLESGGRLALPFHLDSDSHDDLNHDTPTPQPLLRTKSVCQPLASGRSYFASCIAPAAVPGTSSELACALQTIIQQLHASPGDALLHVVYEHFEGNTLWHLVEQGPATAEPSLQQQQQQPRSASQPLQPPSTSHATTALSPSLPLHRLSSSSSSQLPTLSLAAVLRVARHVAAGLEHLHASGVVHGRLCASAVLLQGTPGSSCSLVVKLANYDLLGAASLSREQQQSTLDEAVRFMAPELMRGEPATAACDIYSFGVLLWYMCTGKRPFNHLSSSQIARGVQMYGITLQWPPELLPGVKVLGKACMSAAPKARPSAAQIQQVLRKLQRRLPRAHTASRSSRAAAAAAGLQAATATASTPTAAAAAAAGCTDRGRSRSADLDLAPGSELSEASAASPSVMWDSWSLRMHCRMGHRS